MTLPATLPLSAPLPNGTMEIQCPPDAASIRQHAQPCTLVRGCCSNNGILGIAIVGLCGVPESDPSAQAMTQYEINLQIALCHFDGHSADNVQLLLTPNSSAFLDSLNRPDEQLRQHQAIYRALEIIGGHIGLPILLLFSIFSKTAQRDFTFLNFCLTWIFSSVTFSVGLYRLGPASFLLNLPSIHSYQECLNQAALVSGTQAMTDTAMCALIVQLWFDFRAAIHGPRTTLLSAPYVALLALPALGARVDFLQFQSGRLVASEKSFYCMLFNNNTFLISQYTVLVSILIVTLIFDACIIHILYRRWRFFQQTGGKALRVPLSVVFRVVIFAAYRIVAAVAYMATVLNAQRFYVLTGGTNAMGIGISGDAISESPTSLIPVWADMLQAGTPLVAFLIFGTSKEFLNAWMFWRWFNPILATSMCRRRRSPVTPREPNVYGEVVDNENVVSSDSVWDIRQEMKSTDECLPL
ncbi:hypothetical protein JB92DRAFT_2915702 [Gautieria morchelliformis]|nr:hypothetical protein JB92DRAFT_2915702 [Gautieria morchelliformis]